MNPTASLACLPFAGATSDPKTSDRCLSTDRLGTQLAIGSGPSSRKRKIANNDFLADVRTLRERAKEALDDGAVTVGYGCDVKQSIALLQTVVATELVCVLRYTMHSIAVTGITSESVSDQFAEHANDERKHVAQMDPIEALRHE